MEVHALYLAYRDPRTPWHAKLLIAFVVGYALSPIDLIPDFLPVLGYVDDVVIIPLAVALALKMIPPSILADCREETRQAAGQKKPVNWGAAGITIAIWILLIFLAIILVRKFVRRGMTDR